MVMVEIRELARAEYVFGAGVAGRGFRDNPTTFAMYGDDPLHRFRCVQDFFRAYLPVMKQAPLGAWRAGHVVGVLGMAPPETCSPRPADQLRIALQLVWRIRPVELARGLRWVRTVERHDFNGRHWHIGPVAVEPALQGMGVGSQLMEVFCSRMDSSGEVAFLETEKPENVRFYERFGFETIDEVQILGVTNWFMCRAPAV